MAEGLELDKKEFEILNRHPKNYEFTSNHQIHKQISEAYEKLWREIYPCFDCDRRALDSFLIPYDFEKHLRVIRKVIWYEVQASKPVEEVIGYLNSVSGYRSYLDSHNIPKGSVDDPIEILKETLNKFPDEKVDFITPYYGYALGKKKQ